MARSGSRSPLANDGDRLSGDDDATAVGSPAEYDFDRGLGVLLRGRGLPRGALEPCSVGGEALRLEERTPKLLMLGARELHMVGEFVNEGIGEIRRRARDAKDHRCGLRSVLGPVREFPGGGERSRRDAIQTLRMRSKEVVPRLDGDGTKVVGYRVVESKDRPRVGSRQNKGTDEGPNQKHSERNSTTHETRLPIPRSREDRGPRVEYNGLTDTIQQTRTMEE